MNRESFYYGSWPIVALAAGFGLAIASAAFVHDAAEMASPANAVIQPAEIISKLEALGYTEVNDVEWDDGAWEADAKSPKGVLVEVVIDPANGEVVQEEVD